MTKAYEYIAGGKLFGVIAYLVVYYIVIALLFGFVPTCTVYGEGFMRWGKMKISPMFAESCQIHQNVGILVSVDCLAGRREHNFAHRPARR